VQGRDKNLAGNLDSDGGTRKRMEISNFDIRSVLQEPRSNQGPKVLLLDFQLTYYLITTNLMVLVEVKGN